jgi:lipopolysaccharide cholinephosphotransferase
MCLNNEELRKVQLLQLKCLLEVKRICEKYNINYFLVDGSLIGAIRHKGFIPWDDDIDIAMLREEYDKFLNIIPKELGNEYFLQSSSTEINHGTFAHVIMRLKNTKYRRVWETNMNSHEVGIAIDIFAYDKTPNNLCKSFLYYCIFFLLRHIYLIRIGDVSNPTKRLIRIIMNISNCLLFWLKTKDIHYILEHYHERYINKTDKYRILLAGAWGLKERHLYTTITNLATAVFEGITLPIPADYHLFLTEQYGDYMTPPPKDKQIGRHSALELDLGPYKDIKIEENK